MGIKHMRLMTNNPLKRAGLEGYGLKIDEIVPIVIAPNEHNQRYLEDQTGAHAPQTRPLQALEYKDITEDPSDGIFSVLPQPEILVRKA